MSAFSVALFATGFVLLVAGAEFLVRGAARLAVSIGISALVVGLTVVAFGTSAPELAVTVRSGFEGNTELALGNVFGSNIANVLLILGISAIVAPLLVDSQLIRRDVPLMIGATALVLLLARDGTLGRLDGVLLLGGVVAYTSWVVRASRRERVSADRGEAPRHVDPRRWWVNAGLVVVGLVLLALGARLLVTGAIEVAGALGVSELVVGLTVVALGTSVPELATSVVAMRRGERDIVAGNVVGSNLYNLLLVLGAGALLTPGGLSAPAGALRFDGLVMLVVAVACLPVFFDGGVLRRWEGVVFVGYYVAYVVYLFLRASDAEAFEAYRFAIVVFAVPLTAVTLVIVAWRGWWSRRDRAVGTQAAP